ncbi:hypothetical protein BGZ63DRAFT_425664 [Mariannaea sp. PMI_226]|nr:hypothetical protein BGZ63DRAFT_425664 [Mariannaea sp. PMI_226]
MALPVSTKLPYLRNANELPGPLPTRDEIYISPQSELSPERSALEREQRFLHSFIGGVCGGSISDQIFPSYNPDASINGPFKTAEEVGSAIALASKHK